MMAPYSSTVLARFTFVAGLPSNLEPVDVLAAAVRSVNAHNIVTSHRVYRLSPSLVSVSVTAEIANLAEVPMVLRDILTDVNPVVTSVDSERADLL